MKKVRIRRWITEGLSNLGGSGTARQIRNSHVCLKSKSEGQVHALANSMGLSKQRINGDMVYSLPVPESP